VTAFSEVTTMLGLKFSARVESDIGDLRFGYALCKNPTSPKTGEKWGTQDLYAAGFVELELVFLDQLPDAGQVVVVVFGDEV
jgi:hypothetical protein